MQNQFQEVFDRQRAYFLSDATKSYEWRIGQLTRLEKMLVDNADAFKEALRTDFKTASFEPQQEIMVCLGSIAETKEKLREWMTPEPVALPKRLSDTGSCRRCHRWDNMT
jgi:aldehyde dehydrogenase (NAD+)